MRQWIYKFSYYQAPQNRAILTYLILERLIDRSRETISIIMLSMIQVQFSDKQNIHLPVL